MIAGARVRTAALLAVAAVALAACGDDGGDKGGDTGNKSGGEAQALEGRGPITFATGMRVTSSVGVQPARRGPDEDFFLLMMNGALPCAGGIACRVESVEDVKRVIERADLKARE